MKSAAEPPEGGSHWQPFQATAMAPSRFRREKREVTPFADDPPLVPEEIPAEWRGVEAPPNFTWVGQDELAGMGWPKSRDQIRFLVEEQGVDHLVTLSADKIPPYYAFPELKWSLIPVEDFHGPSIRDIKRFLNIMDEARKAGEAVGVHCAEGRGRTGVMCACFLIYYHDLKPWDAIRVMRRQRPGSVERRVQEDTVVRFHQLLQDFGKEALEDLEEKERLWKEARRLEARARQAAAANYQNLLPVHTAAFYGPQQRSESKAQRLERLQQRMRRCRSMPKMTQEEEEAEKNEIHFRQHLQNFYGHENRCRSQPRDREGTTANNTKKPTEDQGGDWRSSRALTPGRMLVEGLKKTAPRNKGSTASSTDSNNNNSNEEEFAKHFKSFMTTSVKRARSFSQPKDRVDGSNKAAKKSSKDDEEEVKEHKETKDIGAPQEDNSSSSASSTRRSSTSSVTEEKCYIAGADEESDAAYEEADEQHQMDESESPDECELLSKDEEIKKIESPAKRFLDRRRRLREQKEAKKKAQETARGLCNDDNEAEDEESKQSDEESECKSSLIDTDDPGEESNRRPRPPQPSYRPKYTIDSSTTYSYYTRLRSRAAAAAVAAVSSDADDSNDEPKLGDVRRASLDPLRRRAQTVDRDMCITVTVTESSDEDLKFYNKNSLINNSDRILPISVIIKRRPSASTQTTTSNKVDSRNDNSSCDSQNSDSNSSDAEGRGDLITTNRERIIYRRSRTNPLDQVNNIRKKNQIISTATASLNMHASGSSRSHRASSYHDSCEDRRLPQQRPNDNDSVTSVLKISRKISCPSSPMMTYSSSSYGTAAASARRRVFNSASTVLDKKKSNLNLAGKSASSYSPFSRDNWKRTNQRFSYSRFLVNAGRETYV